MEVKSLYTRKLGKKIATKAKYLDSNKFHVVLSEDKHWAVLHNGHKRATKVFPSQLKAIEFAEKTANLTNGTVVIHKETGEIKDLISPSK